MKLGIRARYKLQSLSEVFNWFQIKRVEGFPPLLLFKLFQSELHLFGKSLSSEGSRSGPSSVPEEVCVLKQEYRYTRRQSAATIDIQSKSSIRVPGAHRNMGEPLS